MLSAIRHHRRLLLIFFLLAAAFLYFAHIGSYHLIELDEGRYHRIPMEMVLSGDYLTPHFDYMPYFEKPILQYWVTALAMKLFGFKEFTGRILPALTGFGNVILAYILGRSMYNGRTGLMAAIILATSALQLIVASIGVLDMALTFFVDACLVAFYLFERTEKKKYLLFFYAAMGLGMLTKGLIAIAFPVGILFWYALLTRRPKLFLKLFYVPGIVLFLIIAVPWYYLVSEANPDFFYFFFIREHFLRFATKMHERFHPWYYFVPVLIAGLMPWTGFLATFFSKKGIFRAPGTLRHKQDILLLSLWAGLIYVFYSISDSKLPTYILPCWLPLSILLSASLERCRREKSWLGHSFLINSLLCLLFTAAGVVYLMNTDFLTIADFFSHGGLLIASLLIGTAAAAWYWHKRRSFLSVFVILTVMSYGFGLGAHQIQGQIHDHQTAYTVSQDIKKLNIPDSTPIIMYDYFIPGLVYYLDRPIAAGNFTGELEFGLQHTDRTGMYYSDHELYDLWHSDKPAVVVVEKKYLEGALNAIGTAPARRITDEDYTVLLNGPAAQEAAR